jgi:hypothetical protein
MTAFARMAVACKRLPTRIRDRSERKGSFTRKAPADSRGEHTPTADDLRR